MTHRAALLACLLAWALSWLAQAGERLPRADDPTHFTPADRLAMLRLARRVADAKKPVAFSPADMPAKLLRSTGRPVFVSVHRPGAAPVVALRAKGTLLEQLQGAVLALHADGRVAEPASVRLKIDVVDRISLLGGDVGLAFRRPPVLGIHGLHLRRAKQELYLLPSEALRLDLRSGRDFLRHALKRLGPPKDGPDDLLIERFTTVSFIERTPGGGGPPVDLYRGMPLVERVTRRSALAAAGAGADWLLRFQKPDGSFHYVYHAATDTVGAGQNIVRHAGSAWCLAQAYRATRQRRFLDGARRAVAWLLRHMGRRDDMAWLEREGRRPLGAAALGLIALLELRAATDAKRHDATIRRLGRFLVHMQRDDGTFWPNYDPETHRGVLPKGRVPLFAPGEAFLALVRLGRALPDPVWRRAVRRAADFMATRRDGWNAEHGLEMVFPDSWTMMALDELHAAGEAGRVHADYCLFLAKQVLDEQETAATARWLDHIGAPRQRRDLPCSAVAAGRCEGLLAAWRLARRLGADATVYRQAILRSARFQLAHQYDPTNAYLLPSPDRARGGFYSTYGDHSIRIDFVQHNVSALLGVARTLKE